MAILNFFLFLLLPLLGHACRVDLDCGLGRCVQGGDGRYECSCPAGHGGKRCEAVLRLKRSADETSPCPCSNGDDCTNFSGDDSEPDTSPCVPTQDLPSDGGCTGGKDVWGFVWPNAANDETVDVPCPDGQERASRVCINGVWKAAQVLECDSTGFVETLSKVKSMTHLYCTYFLTHLSI
jgi:hypothetical protein